MKAKPIVDEIKKPFLGLGAAARKIYRWAMFWTLRVARTVLFLVLAPFKGRIKKGSRASKAMDWCFSDCPKKAKERAAFIRWTAYSAFTVVWMALMAWAASSLFGSPIQRAANSFMYVGDGWAFVWRTWMGEKNVPTPSISNSGAESFSTAVADVRSAWYYFQVAAGSLSNPIIAKEWLSSFTNFLIGVLKVVDWLPVVAIVFLFLKWLYSKPTEGEKAGPTKPLTWWDNEFVPKVLRPARSEVISYASWLSEGQKWVKPLFWSTILVSCVIGWSLLDGVTSFFIVLMAFSFSWFPSFVASLAVDVALVLSKIGVAGTAAIVCWLAFHKLIKAALSDLLTMQSSNESVAESLPTVSAVNGPVGSGKTTMVSSITVDGESMFRDYYFSVMAKYSAAFPKFPFEKLEAWVKAVSSRPLKAKEKEKDGPKAKERLATRARIKKAIEALWNQWWDSGFRKKNKAGKEAFFGYDPADGIKWFDGAKEVLLVDAAEAYAESFFMYFSGQKLATSNYPIAMDGGSSGLYFPVFPPSSAYLSNDRRNKGAPKAFSHIFNEDFFRIKNPMAEGDPTMAAGIDGGMVAMTEASNERGNRFDYVGISRKDDQSNKVNDGWNQAMRLIRHWFMVDGRPCCCFIYDYQRADAMNADAREGAEDTIFILDRGPEQNSLPLWWLEDYICECVSVWWNNLYWFSWRPNHVKKTLLNRIIGGLCGLFINHRQRMRYSYGFETVTFDRQHGGGKDIAGQRTIEEYYFIYRRVRGNLFESGVYDPILSQRSLASETGWMDVPTFTSTFANPREFSQEHSFFMEGISKMFSPEDASKALSKIRSDAESNGTEAEDDHEGGADG